jgi:hypothetical protein
VELTLYRVLALVLGAALSIIASWLLQVDVDRWQTWLGFAIFGCAIALINIGLGWT